MNSKEFKKMFGEIAKLNGFENTFGGWIKEGKECIVVLVLQKSNFGDYCQLIINIYIQGIFGNKYSKSKALVKNEGGDVFRGEPPRYKDIFDFSESMDDEKRKERLVRFFSEFIVPFTNKAVLKSGIIELAEKGEVFLLPAIKEELS